MKIEYKRSMDVTVYYDDTYTRDYCNRTWDYIVPNVKIDMRLHRFKIATIIDSHTGEVIADITTEKGEE